LRQKNLEALAKLKNEHHVEIYKFPDEVIAELRKLSKEVLEEEAAKDADFKRIYQAYQAFAENNDGWNELSEAAYAKARKP
jgi:TRAP-type mannitol/chloroaromatic compound transport system substrate-binding protein